MDKCLPKEVWLVGKGPSLDHYDWSRVDGPVVCINETVFLVPDPFAAVAIDFDILELYAKKKLTLPVFKRNAHTGYHFANEWIWYLADVTLARHATAPIALQVMHKWGARIIHFVGFDAVSGVTGYADVVINAKAQGRNQDNYRNISEQILSVIDQLGISPVWEHEQ